MKRIIMSLILLVAFFLYSRSAVEAWGGEASLAHGGLRRAVVQRLYLSFKKYFTENRISNIYTIKIGFI
jgi:hypothetical protein